MCLNRLKDLEVVIQPSVEDVILNLTSLSTTVFADDSRIAAKDLTSIDSYILPNTVVAMLQYIQKELLNNKILSFEEACNQLQHQHDLSNTKILPVKLLNSGTEHYGLVMPTQVLNMKTPDIGYYYPFLHPLIAKANDVVHLLSNIGVQNTLHFSHIQYILQSAKIVFQENKVDFNTLSIILKVTEDLVKLLQNDQPEDDIVQYPKPLYLLNENCVLTECSRLVVCDVISKRKFQLPSGIGYTYLHPLGELNLESALLHFLPKQFGLISLKAIIRYEMVDNKPTENVFHCASVIGEILKSNEFAKALLVFSNCCTHGTTPENVIDKVTKFQSNLTIQYLDTVDVKPHLVIEDNVIAVNDTLSYSFFLKKISDEQWVLNLKTTQSAYALPVFIQLAKQICSRLKLRSTGYFDVTDNDDLPDLATFVGFVLQCGSVSDIASVIKTWLPVHLEVTASNDVVSDSTHAHNEHLLSLLLSEELFGNITERGKDYEQILQTVMEWERIEPQVDLNEAKIWIQQAQYDHSALSTLMNASRTDGTNHFAAICFMCHQVAEKSLKAGVYAKCGMKPTGLRIHDLQYLVNELEEKGVTTINEVTFLNNLYLPTRYPNCHTPSAVPGDQFSTQLAEKGYEIATRIFEAMQEMIGDVNS